MELSDMVAVLRRRIGNPSTTDVTDTILKEHINSAYVEIADNFRFHKTRKLCTFTTVASTRRYGLPTDCDVVLKVRDNTNSVRIEKSDSRRFAELTDTTTEGFPTQYARFRDWIELQPTPDGAYEIQLYYRVATTLLSADTDEPALPASWHEGILRLARWYYYTEEGDEPKANSAYNSYTVWASKKTNEVDEEKVDFDSGVSLPELSDFVPQGLDFNHSD